MKLCHHKNCVDFSLGWHSGYFSFTPFIMRILNMYQLKKKVWTNKKDHMQPDFRWDWCYCNNYKYCKW